MKRVLTATVLIALLTAALYFGGLVFTVLYIATCCCSMAEVYKVTKNAGHQVVEWPSWACLVIAVVFYELKINISLLFPLMLTAWFIMAIATAFHNKKATLQDLLLSALPLLCVVLPSMCMLYLQQPAQRYMQVLLILMAFAIPLVGDIFALLIGRKYGKRKLCPNISPNKTIEGAMASTVASILTAMLLWGIFRVCGADPLPPLWHFPLVGLLGGVAGQMGDLFASMIKRYCGQKDYSSLLPGHGGMMDRLDSVYWATMVVYLYMNVLAAM